jgi:hypothetical protein
MLGKPVNLHLSHLADNLIWDDLQEQSGICALLRGTLTDAFFHLWDLNQQLFSYWPNTLTTRLPAALSVARDDTVCIARSTV